MNDLKPRHARGAPILVRFSDGPMTDHHMTVLADSQGQPPRIVNVAHQPERPVFFDEWRDAPTIERGPQVLTYELVGALDTVPWSYLYRLRQPIQPNKTGASA